LMVKNFFLGSDMMLLYKVGDFHSKRFSSCVVTTMIIFFFLIFDFSHMIS
jgi:hypothetical protein